MHEKENSKFGDWLSSDFVATLCVPLLQTRLRHVRHSIQTDFFALDIIYPSIVTGVALQPSYLKYIFDAKQGTSY